MKRKMAAMAVILCMGAAALTGCNSGKAGVEVDASKNEDLSSQVTAENTVDDNKASYQKFLDAQKAMEDAESMTINSEMFISMTYDGKNDESSQRFDIQRSLIDGKQVVDFVMNTSVKSTKEDGTVDEDASQEQELPGYFLDDTLYFVQSISDNEEESVKLKEEMTYEDLMSIIGSTYILNDITADDVATTAVEESKGTTKYIYLLDSAAMEEYMTYNLASSGVSFSGDGGVTINYANVSADINADGILTAYTFSVDAVIKDDTGEVPFSYKIASAFTGVNSTNVKVKTEDELSEYISTEDYAKQLENEKIDLEDIPSEESTDESVQLTPENAADYGVELVDELPTESAESSESASTAE
ncbi:MAG: hypothetical protein IJ062_03850 [Firmicutes bacterium]|nr:hypothetical protein [Bacillota bacterium]